MSKLVDKVGEFFEDLGFGEDFGKAVLAVGAAYAIGVGGPFADTSAATTAAGATGEASAMGATVEGATVGTEAVAGDALVGAETAFGEGAGSALTEGLQLGSGEMAGTDAVLGEGAGGLLTEGLQVGSYAPETIQALQAQGLTNAQITSMMSSGIPEAQAGAMAADGGGLLSSKWLMPGSIIGGQALSGYAQGKELEKQRKEARRKYDNQSIFGRRRNNQNNVRLNAGEGLLSTNNQFFNGAAPNNSLLMQNGKPTRTA